MPDTTIKKVESDSSPQGEMGQKYLVCPGRLQKAIVSPDTGFIWGMSA